MTSRLFYRNDLQILRAIAVIIVFLYHLNVPYLGGGYIGVDIFFVLSGFFIAQTLPQVSSLHDVWAFYDRRIRRILPLAMIVFLFLMIIAPFVFLPPEMKALNKDFLGALFLVPNISYWFDNSYFESAMFRPMLHYWSLGVEYQYYLVFPLALVIIQRWPFIGVVFLVVSFGLYIVVTYISPKTGFFWMPTRFWEFMLGYYALKIVQRDFFFSVWLRAIMSLSAFCVLIACAILYSSKTIFPGWMALIPAIAAFVFIVAKVPTLPAWLSHPEAAFVRIGTISFSIYLWHYPIIFLMTYTPFVYGRPPDILQGIIAVVVTLILSWVSYTFIEEKFRSNKVMGNRRFYLWIAALFLASIAIAVAYTSTHYARALYDVRDQKIFAAMDNKLPYRCGKIARLLDPKAESCHLSIAPEGTKKRVLLAGNSHADAIKAPFIDLAQEYHADFYLMNQNCNPGQDGCNAALFLNEVKARKVTDFVFHGLIKGAETYVQMDQLIPALLGQKIAVHVIAPTPLYDESIPQFLFLKKNPAQLKMTVESYRRQNADYFVWANAAGKKWPDVSFYETSPFLCDEDCFYENDSGVLYFDGHHLTLTGAELLSPIVRHIYE